MKNAWLGVCLLVFVGAKHNTGKSGDIRGRTMGWTEFDKLINEQKYEEARGTLLPIIANAKTSNDEETWTKALVKATQLRVALDGYETAVRELRDAEWPKGFQHRAMLELYYAWSVTHYLGMYNWEIRQRTRVDSKGPVDLKQLTREQLVAEAIKSYEKVWVHRAELDKTSVDDFNEYISANSFPRPIRGTLRDAVSYLLAQLLANTGYWEPHHHAELFELDLTALAKGESPKPIELSNVDEHPMKKLAFVLGDLETWHRGRNEPEAALEAHLDRLRSLHDSFALAPDRETIRLDLEKVLDANKGVPWWGIGQALLAQWVREDLQDLVRARKLALAGEKAFPSSPGAQACLSVRQQIEAPDYTVQTMALDGVDKRSLRVSHRNLEKLYFRAYHFAVEPRVLHTKNYNVLPAYEDAEKALKQRAEAEWSVALEQTTDYASHFTDVVPKLPKKGVWVIFSSARADFSPSENHIQAVVLQQSNLVLNIRNEGGEGVEVTVVNGNTGQPVNDVKVRLFQLDWQKGHKEIDDRQTNADGVVRFPHKDAWQSHNHILLAEKGDDQTVDPQNVGFYPSYAESQNQQTLFYTDRSIYRPRQKIWFKGITFSRKDATMQVVPNSKISVMLRDANNQQVAEQMLTSNEFGSIAGSFDIPDGRLLGGWSIYTYNGFHSLRVEEYKRPTFEVALKDAEKPLRLNQAATFVGDAKYYFGLPVTAGKAKWTVNRQTIYPWWWGWWHPMPPENARVIASGTTALDADGRFKLTFTPTADERLGKEVSYSYAINVDLTDEGGETRSDSRSYRVGFVSIEGSLAADVGFFREDQAVTLSAFRRTLDGVGRAGKGKYRIVALQQPAETLLPVEQPMASGDAKSSDKAVEGKSQTQGDRQRARFDAQYSYERVMAQWKDGKEISAGVLTHDATGATAIAVAKLEPGAYRVRYETTDDFGAKAETFKDIIVAGKRTPLKLPGLFLAEKSSVPVGGTMRLLAHTGLSQQKMVFADYRAGKRLTRRVLDGDTVELIEIPVKDEHRGGLAFTLDLLRDFQAMHFQQVVFVPWDDKELTLELASFRDKLKPGQHETWRFIVKDKRTGRAEARSAELLTYMYDRSLDAIAPHTAPSILGLYPYRGTASATRWTLMSGWSIGNWGSWRYVASGPSFSDDSLRFYDSYGIGGMGRRGGGYGGGGHMRMKSAPSRAMASDMAAPSPAAPAMGAVMAESEDRAPEKKAAEPQMQAASNGPGGGGGAAEPPPVQVRSNFAETAFFFPQLRTDEQGAVSIEFDVPDSVTSYNVWLHALTKDMKSAMTSREVKAVKELMVRPYLPRFLREADKAELKVVVNNASAERQTGEVTIEVFDPDTKANLASDFKLAKLAQPFTVEGGKSTSVTYSLEAPRRVGLVAFRIIAKAGASSDGELRPLPVLPSRQHLIQSRFVTLRDKASRTMKFEDLLKNDDPSRINEQMVITVDGQLFYGVLKALPYLIEYPYECAEQTMNRFVSAGIVQSVYRDFPSVAAMAKKLAARKTQLEQFDAPDPNRRVLLEETPWLQEAKGGGGEDDDRLRNLLDPKVTTAVRQSALDRLRKMQLPDGGFPWFPGGPASPYITLYLLHGFAKASEFKVDVPQDMVSKAWQYVGNEFRREWKTILAKRDCCWEYITFLNYVASSFPNEEWLGGALSPEERKDMLEFSFAHWKRHSPLLKGYLSLTLKRMNREKDARLVFESVMDSAKTAEDQGTFWAAEDRSWLWYNDTIESHAFALRVLVELMPQNPKKDGLVLWLFLNKKLNHWKSTRATAEVIYSLVHYLRADKSLGAKEVATIAVGDKKTEFVFDPEVYKGKQQLVLGPSEVSDKTGTVTVSKETKGFMFASATWHFSTDKLQEADRGDFFNVSRKYYLRVNNGKEWVLKPIAEGTPIQIGDEVEVQLSLKTKHAAEYVHLRDPRGAGFEPVSTVSRYKWDLGIGFYEEVRDSGANYFFEQLPVGEYTFKYRVRASMAGAFRVGSATVQSMYAPEFNAYSAGHSLSIKP